MATIHIAGITNDPGAVNDFNAGDTYIIDSYTPGEWNGVEGNLCVFKSSTPGVRAIIDISAIGAFAVQYIDFTDIDVVGGFQITADETCVGKTQHNRGIIWPSIARRINFFDTSSGTPIEWDWDFGDKTPHSKVQNPVHDYADYDQEYEVTLLVTNINGYNQITQTVQTGSGD